MAGDGWKSISAISFSGQYEFKANDLPRETTTSLRLGVLAGKF
jgi:hypothetical protein